MPDSKLDFLGCVDDTKSLSLEDFLSGLER